MGHNFIQVGPSLGITREDSCDQISGCIRNSNMVRERVAILSDTPVRCLDISRLKRRFANDQSVNNDTERPNINFVRVATLAFKHLGCYVVRSTANCSLLLTIKVELRRKTEVAQLDLHLVVQE